MKIVYMGTPEIAKVCLEKLYTEGFDIAAVYTKPDTPKNRGMKLIPSEVKAYAVSVGLPVVQPQTFKDDAVIEQLRAFAPDLMIVVAYGKILPQRVLDIPKYGCINMHASILPELRGAGPVQWSILNHCRETGVTAMYLSAGMDEGDIIEIRRTPIDPMETTSELMKRLSHIAAELACDTARAIEAGTAGRTPQEESKATYAPMLSKAMSPIDWSECGQYVIDHVRGLIPWPVATAELDGKTFKIFRVEKTEKTTDKARGNHGTARQALQGVLRENSGQNHRESPRNLRGRDEKGAGGCLRRRRGTGHYRIAGRRRQAHGSKRLLQRASDETVTWTHSGVREDVYGRQNNGADRADCHKTAGRVVRRHFKGICAARQAGPARCSAGVSAGLRRDAEPAAAGLLSFASR